MNEIKQFTGMEPADFFKLPDWLQEVVIRDHYRDIKTLPDGEYAGIYKFIYTWSIIYDFNQYGYEDRWCYHTYEEAKKALDEWNGEGEPQGWHRHPRSGRRRDANGNEWVQE